MLPHLEEVIVSLLTSKIECENDNSYVIFFDDLDIGFSSKDQSSIDSIISLIRVCKHINNDVFGKVTSNVKAVILLRDDIEKFLSSMRSQADTAKLFSTYACRINWFQNEYNARSCAEDDLNLKKFINKRIVYAFSKSSISVDNSDPWGSLVSLPGDQSSFKYIVNHTLYRPRDLLLYFLPLQNGMFSFPLNKSDLFTLTGTYAEELAKELTNEMSSFFTPEEIKLIYNAIGEISSDASCTYSNAVDIIEQNCNDIDAPGLLNYLFGRSIIGNMNPDNRWVYFKCREPISTSDPYSLNKGYNIVVQNGFKVYFQNKGYA